MRIMETSLYVDDLEKARNFYVSMLGFKVVTERQNRHLFLKIGNTLLLLFNPAVTSLPAQESNIPPHGASGNAHVGFEIDEQDLTKWQRTLEAQKIPIEQRIRWENGGISLYFRDPAGNLLELLTKRLWQFNKE